MNGFHLYGGISLMDRVTHLTLPSVLSVSITDTAKTSTSRMSVISDWSLQKHAMVIGIIMDIPDRLGQVLELERVPIEKKQAPRFDISIVRSV
jgi:hypothetical protein